jgi:cyclic dehypoxanthinyl futalosine synthase
LNSESILSEVLEGRRMSDQEFAFLFEHGDLLELGQAACQARDKIFQDDLITFIIDRNINYTNICSCQCKFCAFYRRKTDPDAYVIDKATLFGKIMEAMQLGATQIMLQGGLNEDLHIDFFEDMFKEIKTRYGLTLHSLSAPEVVFIAKNSDLTIADTLLRLKKAGLDSLPGGGAEILHDEVRAQISPNKVNTATWLEVMRTAHRLGLKSTATMMMGTVETLEQRIAHLREIRALQDETNGFRAFIAWTYQPGNNELRGKKMSSSLYLRFLALSRLYLDNFDHIQGSWVTQGERIGQMTLYFGADDLGSLMLEENVVRAAGLHYQMHINSMLDLIRGTGRTPALRDTAYEVLRVFD